MAVVIYRGTTGSGSSYTGGSSSSASDSSSSSSSAATPAAQTLEGSLALLPQFPTPSTTDIPASGSYN